MIQRIQTIYLLVAAGLCFGLFAFEPYQQSILLQLAVIVLGLAELITIFMFKDRKMQILLAKLDILLAAILLFGTIYVEMAKGNELMNFGWPLGMILISVIFLAMANQAIKKDEELVRSADRLR